MIIQKSPQQQSCRMCLHRYVRDGHNVIQLAPNGTEEILDGSRMVIGEEKRREFVSDAYHGTFHRQYGKYGISDVDKALYNKWSSKIDKFYAAVVKSKLTTSGRAVR